jgi:fumarylacetoacetate (FAA) hydrolase
MRLATIDDTTRDGRLVIASADGLRGDFADRKNPGDPRLRTMQAALDHWAEVEPTLRSVAAELNAPSAGFALADHRLRAPLPRAYQWVDGSAYLHHVRLVRKARGAEMPPSFLEDPLVYQGGSDTMLGPVDDIVHASEEFGIDFEAEIGIVTDDVPYGVSAEDAHQHIKLFVLLNDVSLRNLIPAELAKQFGFFNSKPPTAFAPFAVTPDELGSALSDGRVHLRVEVAWNGEPFGHPNAGIGMQFGFHELIAHIAKTRPLGAGTIVGSGTVSNDEPGVGSCCIAEQRTLEIIADGKPKTPFMRFGDRVRIEVQDGGRSVFGGIDQRVVQGGGPRHGATGQGHT